MPSLKHQYGSLSQHGLALVIEEQQDSRTTRIPGLNVVVIIPVKFRSILALKHRQITLHLEISVAHDVSDGARSESGLQYEA